MKAHSREILGLAVFYAAVVAILDYFLTKIPIINWLALGMTFVFFTTLILDTVVKLLAKEQRTQTVVPETSESELGRLEKVIERALVQHQPESIKILDERLKSIVLSAFAIRANQSVTNLHQLAQDDPKSFVATIGDDQISEILAGRSTVLKEAGSHEVGKVLTKIEEWLT